MNELLYLREDMISESIEDFLAKALAGEVAVPIDFEYVSQGDNSGDIQFNGVTYGYIKNDDGTYTVLTPKFEESLQEDFVDDGVNRKVKTPQEIEKELSELSNKFTDREVLVRTELEDEKTLAVNALRKHYRIVEPSDGRMSKDDKMSWVISASEPLNSSTDDYDDNIGDYFTEAFSSLDEYDGWEQQHIDLHKSINWEERDYKDYDTGTAIKANAYLYDIGKEKEIPDVDMHLYLRANPIYPPYYKAEINPFHTGVGPMFDGDKEGVYDIHNRYESAKLYDLLSR